MTLLAILSLPISYKLSAVCNLLSIGLFCIHAFCACTKGHSLELFMKHLGFEIQATSDILNSLLQPGHVRIRENLEVFSGPVLVFV